MNDTPAASIGDVQLDADLELTYLATGQANQARIRYRIDNAGAAPIAVVDTGASLASEPPTPSFRMATNGDLTILYALDAPDPTILAGRRNIHAARVGPGEHYERSVSVKLLSVYPDLSEPGNGLIQPVRLRFCQAYLPFGEDQFLPASKDGAVWLTRPGMHEAQIMLCSAWIDLTQ